MAERRARLLDGARDLGRAAWLVWKLSFWLLLPGLRRGLGAPLPLAERAARFRRLLESAGVTGVKVGQYLAIRLDLLPEAYCRELARLFDAVAPLPFARLRPVIEADLGRPIAAAFARIETEPLAAASIAQVHRARAHDGRLLAVKIQRPGIRETLAADFRNLRRLARLADALGLFGRLSLGELVAEIAAYTWRETDFRQEARTARRLRAEAPPGVRIPAVVERLSGARVLTMEFLHGTPLTRILSALDAGDAAAFARAVPGQPPDAVVDNLALACLHQLFETGVFHGDPHPANILIEPDGTIGFVDFGIFGELAPEDRALLAGYVENLATGRLEAAFEHYVQLTEPNPDTDRRAYRRETLEIMARWHDSARDPLLPVARKLTARFQGEMLGAMRRHGVRMRSELLLFWRALAVLDATAHRLPGRFDLLGVMGRFFARLRPAPLPALVAVLRAWMAPAGLARGQAQAQALLRLAQRRGAPRAPRVEVALTPAGRRAAARRTRALTLALGALGAVVIAAQAPPAGLAGAALAALVVGLAAARRVA